MAVPVLGEGLSLFLAISPLLCYVGAGRAHQRMNDNDSVAGWLAGRAREECDKADARELWVVVEMYEVAGIRELLPATL